MIDFVKRWAMTLGVFVFVWWIAWRALGDLAGVRWAGPVAVLPFAPLAAVVSYCLVVGEWRKNREERERQRRLAEVEARVDLLKRKPDTEERSFERPVTGTATGGAVTCVECAHDAKKSGAQSGTVCADCDEYVCSAHLIQHVTRAGHGVPSRPHFGPGGRIDRPRCDPVTGVHYHGGNYIDGVPYCDCGAQPSVTEKP